MINVNWLLFQILPVLGFLLAVTLLVHQSRHHSPSRTVAWLLVILLAPYVGVPAYMIFGGRKTRRMTRSKASLKLDIQDTGKRLVTQGVGSIFPVRDGNETTLLSSGEEAYWTLIALIEGARHSIDIASFILADDETGAAVLAVLTRKAGEGVRVRLLLDALGSFRISRKVLAPLRAAGGQCAFFMPMMHLPFRGRANLRNHRKIVVADNSAAILGGMNIAREYMGTVADPHRWHDLSLLVKGPVIADLHHVFCSDWEFAAKQETPREKLPAGTGTGGSTALQLVPSGPDVLGDPLYESIITALFKAEYRVWIVTPYFIPDEMLLKAICIAARRGIDVRIVVPRRSNHRLADLVRRNFLRQLQESGAKIHLFRPGMMHGKGILVDTSLGIIGSMNMDMRSFFLNYEVALFIYDERVVKELDHWMSGLMDRSVTGIGKTNVVVEFIEGVARLFAPLL